MRFLSFWQSIGLPPDEDPSIEHLDDELITVPSMSLSVKDIIARATRGTIDLESLVRPSVDTDDDIDDDTFDDVDDMVDVQRIKRDSYEEIRRSLQRDRNDSGGAESGLSEHEDPGEVTGDAGSEQ